MRNTPSPLHSIMLEHGKSTFFIDLIQHNPQQRYVSVAQIIRINEEPQHTQALKINPAALEDLIEALTIMKCKLPSSPSPKSYFSKERKAEMVRRYFKGVGVRELGLQFNCEEFVILEILKNSDVELATDKKPTKKPATTFAKAREQYLNAFRPWTEGQDAELLIEVGNGLSWMTG